MGRWRKPRQRPADRRRRAGQGVVPRVPALADYPAASDQVDRCVTRTYYYALAAPTRVDDVR
jgi:hypothetical protein